MYQKAVRLDPSPVWRLHCPQTDSRLAAPLLKSSETASESKVRTNRRIKYQLQKCRKEQRWLTNCTCSLSTSVYIRWSNLWFLFDHSLYFKWITTVALWIQRFYWFIFRTCSIHWCSIEPLVLFRLFPRLNDRDKHSSNLTTLLVGEGKWERNLPLFRRWFCSKVTFLTFSQC